MAVALDSFVADVTSNAVTSRTLTTLTVGAGANRVLVVALTLQGSATAPSVHWDSTGTNQAMTLITSQVVTGSVAKLWLYGLVAPTSGAKTLSATWTGSSDVTLAAGALTGADQTGGATTFAHAAAVAGTGANSSTVTSATGNWVVGCFTGNGAISAPSATQWWLDNAPNSFSSCGSQITGAATRTVTATGPTPWAFVGCDIVAAGAAASAPFINNTDLPPASPRGTVSLNTWIDPLKLELRGQDTFFSGPGMGPDYDYPNPRGPIPAIELRTWLQALRLRSQDTFFGLAGNPQHDWPNPQPARVSQPWVGQYPLTLTLTIPPFTQNDWPVPKGAPGGITLRTWTDPLKIQLQGQDTFFGLGGAPQTDWPVPRGSVPGISLKTWVDPLKLELAGLDAFFGLGGMPQFNWPNPGRPPLLNQGWIDPLKNNLQGLDTFFGLAGNPVHDWPNPRGSAPPLQAWTDTYKIALNGVPLPFTQGDWPNPRAPGYAITLRTWVDPFKGAGTDTFFGLAGNPLHDWLNPRGAAPLLQTWTDSYKLALNGVPIPFVWQDWPNPRRRAPLLQDWVAPLPVNLAGQDTFFGLAGNPLRDWPNPARAAPLLQSWIDPFKFTLNIAPAPFSQGNWPNPAGPVYAIALKTWVDPFKGVGTDTFFGLGGIPQFDWPNPTRVVVGLIPGIPPSTFYTSIVPTPPVVAPLPPQGGGDDDPPYAEVARRKWLEWSRNRKRRRDVIVEELREIVAPVVSRVARRQPQDRDLLARNLEAMRAGMVSQTTASQTDLRLQEAVAKVVGQFKKIADDDDDIASFLLGDDW